MNVIFPFYIPFIGMAGHMNTLFFLGLFFIAQLFYSYTAYRIVCYLLRRFGDPSFVILQKASAAVPHKRVSSFSMRALT